MRLFVDSANASDIREAINRGCGGVTTNPSLLAREGGSPVPMLKAIVEEIDWSTMPLSVELWAIGREAILDQARWLRSELQYEHLVFKLPIGWDELALFSKLLVVNATACMTANQAVLAACAGARYASIFWGRIRDGGEDPYDVVSTTRRIFGHAWPNTEIIVGSIRKPEDVALAFSAGAHIVTVPPSILRAMCQHPKTDEIVAQFARDAAVLSSAATQAP